MAHPSSWGKSWADHWGASWGSVKNDGRSGYWRLFFTQLQEDADKPPTTAISPAPTLANNPKVAPSIAPKKTIRKFAAKVTPEVEVIEPFRPLPVHKTLPDEPTYLQQMWVVTNDLREMVADLQQSTVKFNKELDARDEADIELLLLVL